MSQLSDFDRLDLSENTDKFTAEYVWIGASCTDLRSKVWTLTGPLNDLNMLPTLNYDGSSWGQAPKEGSEMIICPQAIFKNPFRRGNNVLVICDAYTPDGKPLPTNRRYEAAKIFQHPDVLAEEPMFKIKQEYIILQKDMNWPVAWPTKGYPAPREPGHYVRAGDALNRQIAEAHLRACLYAGLDINLMDGEMMPEPYPVGISASDQLVACRYILQKISEVAEVVVSFDPNPILGDYVGGAARIVYSTKSMRNGGGYKLIAKAKKYGLVPKENMSTGKVDYERRCPSNIDPYAITSEIAKATILAKSEAGFCTVL